MSEPIVQAELVEDDTERRRLRARAVNRHKCFAIWLREAEGTVAFKRLRTHLLLESITDPREAEKLSELGRKIRSLLESCAPPPTDPAIDDPADQEGDQHA